jgi:hypothetical protein
VRQQRVGQDVDRAPQPRAAVAASTDQVDERGVDVLEDVVDDAVLLASLTAYGVSAAVCIAMSYRNNDLFDFDLIRQRVTAFDPEPDAQAELQPEQATEPEVLINLKEAECETQLSRPTS